MIDYKETYTTEDKENVYNKKQRKQKTEETKDRENIYRGNISAKNRGTKEKTYTTRKLCAVRNLSLKAKHHIVHHN